MKKRVALIVLFICSFIFVNCFCFSKDEVIALNNQIEIIDNTNIEEKIDLIDINELRKSYSNNDIVGVIKIDSLDLETVIVKGSDNEYYLKHDINKNKSIFGTEFVDSRNSSNLSYDKQINIYGHNSRNKDYYSKLEFTKLNKIVDKDIFDELSDIYFYIDNEVLIYKPLLVKVITTDNEYTRLVYRDSSVLKKHLSNLTSNTMYCKDDCSINENNNIIILQTCYYEPDNSYLLLIGIR
jgi:sortase B